MYADALQRMCPTVLERDPRTRDEVLHSPGHEDLARPGQGSDVHADAPHVTVSELHLPGVHASADLDVECTDAVADGLSRLDASRRAVEGREQAIAGGLDSRPPDSATRAAAVVSCLSSISCQARSPISAARSVDPTMPVRRMVARAMDPAGVGYGGSSSRADLGTRARLLRSTVRLGWCMRHCREVNVALPVAHKSC